MITEGFLGLHYRGRKGGRGPALLDVAQDYALKIVFDSDLYSLGLILKGGTALRKYRVGSPGRFSTDLDFSTEEPSAGELLLDALDGSELFEVRFSLTGVEPGRRGSLSVGTPLGSPGIDAKIEISPRGSWMPGEWLDPIPMAVHKGYEFTPVKAYVMAFEESLAEKLAAFRRRALVRDLYDLALFETGAFDEALVRKLTYLKVFVDVVEQGLGEGPFDPEGDILLERKATDFLPEDIGILSGEIDIDSWIRKVRTRYVFLRQATPDELRWSKCNPRNARDVKRAIEKLRDE